MPETHAVQHLQRRSTRRTSWSYDPVGNKDEKWWLRMGRKSIWTTMCPLQWTETRLDIHDDVLKDKHLVGVLATDFPVPEGTTEGVDAGVAANPGQLLQPAELVVPREVPVPEPGMDDFEVHRPTEMPSPSCHRRQFSATWAANRT